MHSHALAMIFGAVVLGRAKIGVANLPLLHPPPLSPRSQNSSGFVKMVGKHSLIWTNPPQTTTTLAS